jgi:hypothetical protein
VRVLLVLLEQPPNERGPEGRLAPGVAADRFAQRRDRIALRAACLVVPALDGPGGEAHRLARDRVS